MGKRRRGKARKKGRYGGPWVSRQNQKHHGKTQNLTATANISRQNQISHGKTKKHTAKPKISRQNQKPHGKTKNLTAKPKTSRQTKNLTGKPNRATAEVINTAEATSSFPVPTYWKGKTKTGLHGLPMWFVWFRRIIKSLESSFLPAHASLTKRATPGQRERRRWVPG